MEDGMEGSSPAVQEIKPQGPPEIIRPEVPLKDSAIEDALNDPDFRSKFPFSTRIETKYAMAYTLVNDGRIEDPTFLLDGLVPSAATLSRANISDERKAEVIEKASKYEESLRELMVQKGILEPEKWSVKKATQEAPRYIANDENLKSFISFFGASNTADILYRLHPQFKGVPQDRVKGLIAEYLGDFLLQAGPLNLDNVADKLRYLSEPDLRQGLIEVWKRDALTKISDVRKSSDQATDEEILKRVFDEYSVKVLQVEDDNFIGIFDEIDQYYMSLLDIKKPEHIVDSLNGGRQFPDLNQRINTKELEEKKRLLIADEMGLGKSASAILAKEIIGVKSALIVAPSNVVSVWQNFLSDNKDQNGKNTGYFKEGNVPRVLTVDDPDVLSGINVSDFDYILISQERLNENHMESLRNLDVGMLIVDEFHKLKNLRDGVRAGHLIDLAEKMEGEDKYVVLLSGTPIPNKVEDIAIALKLLYPDKFEEIDNPTLIRSIIHGDIVDIRNLLLPRMQSKSLVESLEMPELSEIIEYVDLEGIEKNVYEEILNEDELSSTVKLQILRQYLLNNELIDPTPGIESSKIKRLGHVIARELENKEKVVVYVNDYTNGVIRGERTMLDRLGIPPDVRVEVIDGPVSQEERQRIQREMGEQDGKTVVFVSGQTADVGVDFSAADSVVFYNEPWSKFTKRQQLARVYRPGVKHPITSTTLIANGTIEEGINRYIAVKERAIEKLLRGIPTTDIEKQMLEKGEHDVDKSLEVNPELAAYYFSSFERLNKIFRHVKGIGEKDFTEFLRQYAQSYAGAYTDLGSRSYQANACRVSGTLIDRFVREAGDNPENIKILDIASGPEMLRKHMPEGYKGNIYSLDINKHHFSEESQESMVGSFLHLPIRDESIDYANLSLAWHYTAFSPSKENYERIEVLAEANRVLKKGGRLVLNNIYSRDIKNTQLFEEMVYALGFKIVSNYTGEISEKNYNSHVFTLEKVEYPGMSPQEIAGLIGKDHYDGLKFVDSNKKLKDSRKVAEEFSINGIKYPMNLNTTDKGILEEEQQITLQGEELKKKYGGIEKIPRDEVVANEFIRLLLGKRYVLFKKLQSAGGAVVVK